MYGYETLMIRIRDAANEYAVHGQIENRVSPNKVHAAYLVKASRRIGIIAKSLQTDAVKAMRSDDHDWYAVASVVLGKYFNYVDAGNAVDVFELVADGGSDDASTLSWQCNECQKTVTDYGPYSTNPDVNERGHGQDCPRHAAAQLFYETRTDNYD